MTQPSVNGTDGAHDADDYKRQDGGKFAPGNKGGPGDPHSKKRRQFTSLLMNASSEEDFLAIVRKMIEDAKDGDRYARKEYLDRLLGPVSHQLELSGDGAGGIIFRMVPKQPEGVDDDGRSE